MCGYYYYRLIIRNNNGDDNRKNDNGLAKTTTSNNNKNKNSDNNDEQQHQQQQEQAQETARCDWTIRRDDDTPEIIEQRLQVYHRNADPILEYFSTRKRLLTLTPYNGFQDLPMLVENIYAHVE